MLNDVGLKIKRSKERLILTQMEQVDNILHFSFFKFLWRIFPRDVLLSHYLYNKALCSYIYIYMSAIAGQAARTNWLKFFEGTCGTLGVTRHSIIFYFTGNAKLLLVAVKLAFFCVLKNTNQLMKLFVLKTICILT